MKKSIVVLIISCATLLFLCTSCSLLSGHISVSEEFRLTGNEQEIANEKMDSILKAIQEKDNKALKGLFADNIVEQTNNLDQSIGKLFDYYQGDFISYDDHFATYTDELVEYGEIQKLIYPTYDVKTSEQAYRVAMEICVNDTTEPKNGGIRSLYIIRSEDDPSDYCYRGDEKFTPGINIGIKNMPSEPIDAPSGETVFED